MVDLRHGLFGDWCELNFKEGVTEAALSDLRQDYDRIDAIEEERSSAVAARARLADHRLVTFIPSVIAEYDQFWKNL